MEKHTKQKQRRSLPREISNDKEEKERKYKVRGDSWETRVQTLSAIFDFVASERNHFVTLGVAPHTSDYHPKLLHAAKAPTNTKPLRTRYYWATVDLDGYNPGDVGKAELRTEKRLTKKGWEQVLKLGGSNSETFRRGEYQRVVDRAGINLGVYPPKVEADARKIIGRKAVYPLVTMQGQSEPVLYHPDGRRDVLFEIKFDKGIGRTFDGFEEELVEIEIEVKRNLNNLLEKEIEKLLDKSKLVLMGKFADHLKTIYEAKAAPLFDHLVGYRERDPKGFEKAARKVTLDMF